MQRLFVTLSKSSVLRTSSRSGSLFGSTHRNVEKKTQTNTGIFFREYSKIPVNDLRVGMVHVDAKGKNVSKLINWDYHAPEIYG